ncbi:MAG: hypothetical protein RLY20_903 [Verrucomicrobiota bacterium]|jgi:ADP-heptose:LPS heptosyltransferase
MRTLIIKLGAAGDVVRTTTLMRTLPGEVTWITAAKSVVLVEGVRDNLRVLSWEQREVARDRSYDLVVNLEDTLDVADFVKTVKHARLFGAYADAANNLTYSEDARRWFDLSLISRFGRVQADKLKYENRASYQELIFEGLDLKFTGQKYYLPPPAKTGLSGDVAVAPVAGPVWPMKNWAYYEDLIAALKARGLVVNVLPNRPTLLEHLGDVFNHRCLVGGDSLPMHFALGFGIPCVTIFNCTSPWEIFDYGIQRKLVSPLLGEFFYKRGFEVRATNAIPLQAVLDETLAAVNG